MNTFTNIWNTLNSVGALLLAIATIGLLVLRFVLNSKTTRFESWVATHKLCLIGLITVGATIASLVYSNIIGFPPCTLCWLQRVAIYPIAVISIVAMIRKETIILPYIKIITLLGWCVALYHIMIYYTGFSPLPCDATVSCTARYVYEFGFMTIPLMSFIAFTSIFAILYTREK